MARISRDALYEEVWSKPMTTVAQAYGITSTALKKTCKKHQIPTPERGYWAKQQNGKPVRKQPLPKLRDERLATIHIAQYRRPVSEAVQQAKAAAHSRLEVAAKVQALQAELTSGLPILAGTRRAIAKARPNEQGYVEISGAGIFPLKIGPSSADRALSVVSKLFRLAQGLGYEAKPSEKGLALVIDGEAIEFAIEEKPERQPHTPTPSELKRQANYNRMGISRDVIPTHEFRPSGNIAVIIQSNQHSGLRRTFGDRMNRKLEVLLPDVLAAFAEHAAFSKERRTADEERRQKWKEEEDRRKREQEFERREQRRMKVVEAVHQQLADRSKLAGVLAHLDSGSPEAAKQVEDMAGWLRGRIEEIDALLSPLFLELSARSAKIDFNEACASAAAETTYTYYPSEVTLHFWRIDEHEEVASAVSAVEWRSDRTSNK